MSEVDLMRVQMWRALGTILMAASLALVYFPVASSSVQPRLALVGLLLLSLVTAYILATAYGIVRHVFERAELWQAALLFFTGGLLLAVSLRESILPWYFGSSVYAFKSDHHFLSESLVVVQMIGGGTALLISLLGSIFAVSRPARVSCVLCMLAFGILPYCLFFFVGFDPP